MPRVFVDGQHGTTGLEIRTLLAARSDVELIDIDANARRSATDREARLNEADAVILCLPDDAATEAVTMLRSAAVRIIDASTAHRVADGWVYGLPELPGQRQSIAQSRRVANPGCYPTGFLLAVRPLIDAGVIPRDLALTVHAVSGYSGGGRKLIERFAARAERARGPDDLLHAQAYALSLEHKHLPEMRHYAGTTTTPIFCPSVGHFYRGMVVSVPLFAHQLTRAVTPADVVAIWQEAFRDEPCVKVWPAGAAAALEEGYLDPQAANHTNNVELFAFGGRERLLLAARLDNLGKGAARAAVQNLNLMLGLPELAGLTPATDFG